MSHHRDHSETGAFLKKKSFKGVYDMSMAACWSCDPNHLLSEKKLSEIVDGQTSDRWKMQPASTISFSRGFSLIAKNHSVIVTLSYNSVKLAINKAPDIVVVGWCIGAGFTLSARNYSRARAYNAWSRCRWELFGHFSLIYHFSLLSPSLWETARYRLKYCLKGQLSPKQPTNYAPDK